MSYLIDGHNLIGQMPDISLSDPDDEAKLVQKLMGFCARTGKKCVVIFDGGIPGGFSALSTSPVEVVFAAPRTSADRVMQERIRDARDPGQWIVVSNDREVMAAAEARRMKVMRSAAFAPLLARAALGTKPAPLTKKQQKEQDAGSNANPYVSPSEVEQWLAAFEKRKKK